MTDRYEKIRKALEMGPTPGPWYVEACRYGFAIYASKTYDPVVKTEDTEGRYGAIDKETDARLIAACDPDTIRELLAERDQLAAALGAAQADAERYRWLRDKCDRWDGGLVVAEVTEFSLSSWSGDNLDAAIDAAMRKENSND